MTASPQSPALAVEQSARPDATSSQRWLFLSLASIALVYAFLAGLRTVTDYDLGWQLATGRWIVQHRQIPSTDVLSYTAAGKPWIYPIGSEVALYALYRGGGYEWLSWAGAIACVGTILLLLRRASALSAVLAIVAVPRIAGRTAPRAEMFTVVLFAAFLSIVWQQHSERNAPLWLLPPLMVLWVNLHLGFIAGLALVAAYVAVEVLEAIPSQPGRRQVVGMLGREGPWLLITFAATLVNPWGWGIYRALLNQQRAMALHAEWISEWAGVTLNHSTVQSALSGRDPRSAFLWLLAISAVAVILSLLRRRWGPALLLSGAAWFAERHVRLQALFACLVVVVAGTVLTEAWSRVAETTLDRRLRGILAAGCVGMLLLLAGVRSADLVSQRHYLAGTDLASFGTGLSWWFPERAAAFVERENIPGQIFDTYNEGGYIAWRLGPKYKDYIDGRAIPFGPQLFQREGELLQTPPDSPAWNREAERYGINAVIVSLARYDGLQIFRVLRDFCVSPTWRPVFLDEVSAVFVRRQPATEALIQRSQIDCATVQLPANPPRTNGAEAFNQWANASTVLEVLGRDPEAWTATENALRVFPDSAIVHFVRGNLLMNAGNWRNAESEYLSAAYLEPSEATYSALADLYRTEGRMADALAALQQAAAWSNKPYAVFLSLGFTYLQVGRPGEALTTFDKAASEVPTGTPAAQAGPFFARLAQGRAFAWNALGNLSRATFYAEEAARLAPHDPDRLLELARLYELQGRVDEARQIRARAMALQRQP